MSQTLLEQCNVVILLHIRHKQQNNHQNVVWKKIKSLLSCFLYMSFPYHKWIKMTKGLWMGVVFVVVAFILLKNICREMNFYAFRLFSEYLKYFYYSNSSPFSNYIFFSFFFGRRKVKDMEIYIYGMRTNEIVFPIWCIKVKDAEIHFVIYIIR